MGCDMVVALDGATTQGRAIFGQNTGRPSNEPQRLHRAAGRAYTAGETLRIGQVDLTQPRCTYTAVGAQAAGMWGYHCGINEKHLAIGCAHTRTKFAKGAQGLQATDLVRLGLERSTSARQAVDLITDLLARHGQAAGNGGPATDGSFLVADGREAFALETSGRYWVLQEVCEVRAMSDQCTIRQDWNRIAPGLAGDAIERGWWPEDGSKIDFAGALGFPVEPPATSMRRWGRATFLLQEQNGHIDQAFLRRLLSDHGEESKQLSGPGAALCEHARARATTRTVASMVAELDAAADALAVVWCAFGPPCLGIYCPVFLAGSLPEPFSDGALHRLAETLWSLADEELRPSIERPRTPRVEAGSTRLAAAREQVARLQEQFDQQAGEFHQEAVELQHRREEAELQRQATLFHQHMLESFEKTMEDLMGERLPASSAVVAW